MQLEARPVAPNEEPLEATQGGSLVAAGRADRGAAARAPPDAASAATGRGDRRRCRDAAGAEQIGSSSGGNGNTCSAAGPGVDIDGDASTHVK